MELQSFFRRAVCLYYLCINFRTLKFDVWRRRLANTSTLFRVYDRFLHPCLHTVYSSWTEHTFWPIFLNFLYKYKKIPCKFSVGRRNVFICIQKNVKKCFIRIKKYFFEEKRIFKVFSENGYILFVKPGKLLIEVI